MQPNFLTRPLTHFHSQFITIFDQLPPKGKILEIARRVAIAVASLLAYPVFSCLYLIGRFYDRFLNDETRIEINISTAIRELRPFLLDKINKAKAVDTIQSAKFFFHLKLDAHSIRKDYIIRREDKSAFDKTFLTQQIQLMTNELERLIQQEIGIEQPPQQLRFKWNALIKGTDRTFARACGSISQGTSSNGSTCGTFPDIPLNSIKFHCELALTDMGRKFTPQLNDEWEFV